MTPEQIDNPIAKVESKEALILADLAAIFKIWEHDAHMFSSCDLLIRDQILSESLWAPQR